MGPNVKFDTTQTTKPKLRRILAVDDSKLNVTLLQKSLSMENYEVLPAHNGVEAIEAVKQNDPDLVLLDVMMPGMDGYEVCREVKRYCKESGKFIPVVLLTALDKVENKVAGFDAGADDYLVKPPARNELLARVRSMLRIKDLQESLLETNQDLQDAQKVIEEELSIVGQIQRSFLPTEYPKHSQIDIATYYLPSSMAGGDYYDVIEVDKNHWGLLMADVTGHGASAAVVMAVTHLLMRSFVNTFLFPSTALKVVNEKLNAHLSSEHFVTMFYGILDTQNMNFIFSSAGHNPMFLYRASNNTVIEMKTNHGFPLRAFRSDNYDEGEISIEPGDKLIMFTDGITETMDNERRIYGDERLSEIVCQVGSYSAQETIDALIMDWEEFRNGAPVRDDMSLLVLRRSPE